MACLDNQRGPSKFRDHSGSSTMIQVALLVVSAGLIVLGIKGFMPGGLALRKKTTLTGPKARLVGVLCILGGLALIPLFLLVIWAYGD